MPLTPKGEEIESKMKQEYGAKKGEQVFYASRNAGTIKGVDSRPPVVSQANFNTYNNVDEIISSGMNHG